MTTTDEQHNLAAAMAFLKRVADPPQGLDMLEAVRREGDRWWAQTLLAEFYRLRAIETRAQDMAETSSPIGDWRLAARHILATA